MMPTFPNRQIWKQLKNRNVADLQQIQNVNNSKIYNGTTQLQKLILKFSNTALLLSFELTWLVSVRTEDEECRASVHEFWILIFDLLSRCCQLVHACVLVASWRHQQKERENWSDNFRVIFSLQWNEIRNLNELNFSFRESCLNFVYFWGW